MRLSLLFLWLVGGLTVTGCAPSLALHTSVPYRVDSTPPGSTVLVDGQVVGTTPVDTELVVSRWWVGHLRAPTGWAYGPEQYTVTVVLRPESAAQGMADTRVVQPGQTPTGGMIVVHFTPAPG